MALTDLERACIAAFREGTPVALRTGDELGEWIAFGLSIILEAGRMLRAGQHDLEQHHVDHKADGSPTTVLEHEVELLLRARLADLDPAAYVVGEETGGDLPSSGIAVAIDPVDGTWAFLTSTGTYATTLSMFRDGVPFLGLVSNPTTGEIGYAAQDERSRMVVLSLFGEPDAGFALPFESVDVGKVLVNVHPNPSAGPLVDSLYTAWNDGGVQAVRSPGGSPCWALLQAAKGNFVYVNRWSKRPPEPYDLVAGVMLVRGAGGDVTDLHGLPIDPLTHTGPFVAAVSETAREKVLGIVNRGSL
jgi:fructose-1,6-bisphosphatase/inositol monophosphatase family enzyme